MAVFFINLQSSELTNCNEIHDQNWQKTNELIRLSSHNSPRVTVKVSQECLKRFDKNLK